MSPNGTQFNSLDEPPAETAEKVLPKNKDAVPKIKSEKELIEEKSFHLAPWITGRANSYATEKKCKIRSWRKEDVPILARTCQTITDFIEDDTIKLCCWEHPLLSSKCAEKSHVAFSH